MRFLADESCDFGVVRALRAAGHDKDFGRLVFATTHTTGGVILIRFPGDARTLLGSTVVEAVSRYGDRLSGSFVVMSPGRIRIAEKP